MPAPPQPLRGTFSMPEQSPAAAALAAARNCRFEKSVVRLADLPPASVPEIAFAGRSNVGKSSLMNRLLGRRNLVRVSGRPGCTRGLNFFDLDGKLYLVDLPGYGFAKVPASERRRWEELVGGYLEARETLAGVVLIVDIRHEAKPGDRQMLGWLKERGLPFLVVYTKADKLSGNAISRQTAVLDAGLGPGRDNRIVFSAKNGRGREELLYKLQGFL